MSNIRKAFEKGKAFIPFITCGDPDLETTASVIRAAAEAGADLIELGVPFSDPVADGPVMEKASLSCLANGTCLSWLLHELEQLAPFGAGNPQPLFLGL